MKGANERELLSSFGVCFGTHYLFPAHVNKKLGAIWAEGNVRSHQHSQAVIIVRQFHWNVP